ncbi:MAG: penicillin-binding transpeptidase domain-containing protein [Desulfovibrionaceae bacterium]|nr:penicillin-binding transpeptidase domain-containing protein [Desulfovibrionaceae bacterium]
MRRITGRVWILLALTLAFAAGLVILAFGFARNGARWATNRANAHIYAGGAIARAGRILDANGVVLAETKNGKRVLHPNAATRRATLHAVGDPQGFVSTGAHAAFRGRLTGYSRLTGLYQVVQNNEGSDARLTIGADLSKAAYRALNGRSGAVGVYNYKTGDVVCMVSSPNFDPLNKPRDIENNSAYEAVYLNRLLHGLFTPGSTFKIITAACALEYIPDIWNLEFRCDGGYNTGDGRVICREKHGKLGFEKAMNVSCNSAFAQIAILAGQKNLQATAEKMGFNRVFYSEKIPLAISRFQPGGMSPLELGWAGVGQHTTLANPAHMLMLMGAIANGGKGIAPRLLARNSLLPAQTALRIDPAIAGALKDLLRSNVTNVYDTGGRRTPGIALAGKTGTAEVDGKRPHAWFVGFALDAPYAIVVVGENAGGGLAVAFDIAARVINAIK